VAEVEAWSSRVKLRSVTAIAPGRGLGVDRRRGNPSAMCAFMALSRGIVAGQARVADELLIRWFRVRPPGAPRALACGYASLRVIMSSAREARVGPR
jgi:hypothetical protein